VKKVLEAGLVDKHSAIMFERWGQLEPGAADLVGQKQVTAKSLADFAEDIESLLESNVGEVKETRLDVRVTPPVLMECAHRGYFSAFLDELGRLIVGPEDFLVPGDMVWQVNKQDDPRQVLEIVRLYQGDVVTALQVTVDKPE
jgi:hypothetical protein